MSDTFRKDQIAQMILAKLRRNFGRTAEQATNAHMFQACALVVRDIMSANNIGSQKLVQLGQ